MVKMARDLSKKYVRDVAIWYNALGLHQKPAETEEAGVGGA